jgi:hypothetical protein
MRRIFALPVRLLAAFGQPAAHVTLARRQAKKGQFLAALRLYTKAARSGLPGPCFESS